MKQLNEPKVDHVSHPDTWKVFCIALGFYFFAYYLGDLILLATSFEDFADFGFVIQNAGKPLIQGLYVGLVALICPLGHSLLFLPFGLHSRRSLILALVTPLLIFSCLIVFLHTLQPCTSKGRLEHWAKLTLPPNHSRFLAYHPLGASMTFGAGIRDYYCFELDPKSMETFLAKYQLSEERKIRLQAQTERYRDLPPEMAHDLQSLDLRVYPSGRGADIITVPASARVLVICHHPPL